MRYPEASVEEVPTTDIYYTSGIGTTDPNRMFVGKYDNFNN